MQTRRLGRPGGHPTAKVVQAWVMAQAGVTAPIVGPGTIERLHDAIDAAGLTPPPELLDALFPGPGGAAPEAYAW